MKTYTLSEFNALPSVRHRVKRLSAQLNFLSTKLADLGNGDANKQKIFTNALENAAALKYLVEKTSSLSFSATCPPPGEYSLIANPPTKSEEMETTLKDFVAFVEELTGEKMTIKKGRVYCRIYTPSSIYCFIALNDVVNKTVGFAKKGSLLMAAGYKTPAKHPRGNLFDRASWDVWCGKYGINYIK